MKRNVNFRMLAGLAAMLCSATMMACANQGQDASTMEKQEPVVIASAQTGEGGSPVKAEQQVAEAPLYTEIPKSLSPVECGGCHIGQYKRLRESNSKHRFECTDCHEQLHAYIPYTNNYEDIMPKCSSCHDLPHGEAFPKCSQCHQDPHSPLKIPFSGVEQKIKNKAGKDVVACSLCHSNEGEEMDAHPSKHNVNVGCTGCHADMHGVRPTCFDCHEPHVAEQVYADCLVCHAPHSAKNILQYPEEMPNTVCASCHTQVYDNLQANHTKHTELQCASCHVSHGQIPMCQECHAEPHGAAVHKRFPNCLECHVDPHNLPVNPQT